MMSIRICSKLGLQGCKLRLIHNTRRTDAEVLMRRGEIIFQGALDCNFFQLVIFPASSVRVIHLVRTQNFLKN